MATVTVFPVALTVAGTPRVSPTFNYSGVRTDSVMLQIVSTTWATDDPSITVSVVVEESFDGGAHWQQFCGMTTQPRVVSTKTGALPMVKCYAGDSLGPRIVRAVLSVDKLQLTVGVDATT